MALTRGGSGASALTVTLLGNDQLSGVLARAATAGVVAGNTISAAFRAVGSAVSGVTNTFTDMVKSASSTQMDLIGSAGALVDVLGQPFEKTLDFAKQLNNEFVALGAKLPGTAEDFAMVGRSVSDDILAAFKGADGKVDLPNAKKTLMSLTEGWTLLAQQSKTSAADAGQLMGRLLGGDIATLRMAMFDKSPAFKNALDKVLKADGKTREDWTKATTKQRAEWLNEATRLTIPKEAIAAMSNTVDGTLAGWKSAIFDPTTGVLGMLRVLTNRGGKNAMDALFALLKASEDVFSELVRLFPFKVDIMVVLYDSFTAITNGLNLAKGYLSDTVNATTGINNAINALTSSGLDALKRALTGLPMMVLNMADRFTNLMGGLQSNLMKSLPTIAGFLKTAQGMFAGAASGIGNWLNSLLADLMPALAGATNTAASLGRTIVSSIDWGTLGKTIGVGFVQLIGSVTAGVMTFLANLDISQILGLVGDIVVNLIRFLSGLADGVKSGFNNALSLGINTLASLVVGAVNGWVSSVATGVTKMVGNLIGFFTSGLGRVSSHLTQTVLRIVDSVVSFASNLVGSFSSALTGTVSAIVNKAGEMANDLVTMFTSFFSQLIQGITAQVTNIGQSVGQSVSNAVGSVASGIGGAVGGVVNAVTGGGNSGGNQGGSTGTPDPGLMQQPGVKATARASGFLEPLNQAIAREKSSMPPGSSLVIANSSEAILTRTQQREIAKTTAQPITVLTPSATPDNKTVNYSPNISIQIDGADNPQMTAEYVINELARLFTQFEATI